MVVEEKKLADVDAKLGCAVERFKSALRMRIAEPVIQKPAWRSRLNRHRRQSRPEIEILVLQHACRELYLKSQGFLVEAEVGADDRS